MPETYAFTDFDEEFVIEETNYVRTVKATRPDSDDAVIIKQFDPEADWFDDDRFRDVLAAWDELAAAEHHVLPLVSAGFMSEPWIAVDYTNAGTAASHHVFEDVVVAVTAAAADVLSHAHRLGIYHSHITPSTFRFRYRDEPMSFMIGQWEAALADLPQPATATHWHADAVSPYLAPEQTRTDTETITATEAQLGDIYQLGMTAYAMLTFEDPTPEPDIETIADEISEGFPDRNKLANTLATAVEHNPNNRYQSMAEFASALRDIRVRM